MFTALKNSFCVGAHEIWAACNSDTVLWNSLHINVLHPIRVQHVNSTNLGNMHRHTRYFCCHWTILNAFSCQTFYAFHEIFLLISNRYSDVLTFLDHSRNVLTPLSRYMFCQRQLANKLLYFFRYMFSGFDPDIHGF